MATVVTVADGVAVVGGEVVSHQHGQVFWKQATASSLKMPCKRRCVWRLSDHVLVWKICWRTWPTWDFAEEYDHFLIVPHFFQFIPSMNHDLSMRLWWNVRVYPCHLLGMFVRHPNLSAWWYMMFVRDSWRLCWDDKTTGLLGIIFPNLFKYWFCLDGNCYHEISEFDISGAGPGENIEEYYSNAVVWGSTLRILGNESYDMSGGQNGVCRKLPFYGQQRSLSIFWHVRNI